MKYKTNLKKLLWQKRMTQQALADKLGTSQSRTSAYVLGKEKPSPARLEVMRGLVGGNLYFSSDDKADEFCEAAYINKAYSSVAFVGDDKIRIEKPSGSGLVVISIDAKGYPSGDFLIKSRESIEALFKMIENLLND